MTRIAVVNGPNLNLLGTREPGLYGRTSFADLEAMVRAEAGRRGAEVEWLQSNHEGELVDLLQGLPRRAQGALINLGAYTHTSLAIRDALLAAPLPFVEVHLSNLFRREPERHRSLSADLAIGVIAGFGARGYLLGLTALLDHLADG